MSASKALKSEIMKSAWAGAKKAAAKFGGKASQYFGEVLKIVWANAKRECKVTEKRVLVNLKELGKTVKFRIHFGQVIMTNYEFQKARLMGLVK